MSYMEPEVKKHPLDEMSELEVFAKLVEFFGSQRTAELLGWAFIGALVNWDNPAELRRQLEERGMTKSGLYRAMSDFRRFGEHIEQTTSPARDTTLATKYMKYFGNMRVAVP